MKKGEIAFLSGLVLVCISAILFTLFGMPSSPKQAWIVPQEFQTKAQVLGSKNEVRILPSRLRIPKIQVDALVQYVAINDQGEMGSPHNIMDVGWFAFGPTPGERGSSVIAGHSDGDNGEDGVFAQLHRLEAGDKVFIEGSNGESQTFVVRESRTYSPGYANEVFGQNLGTHLNLITCDGAWSSTQNGYTKRLVVFADMER